MMKMKMMMKMMMLLLVLLLVLLLLLLLLLLFVIIRAGVDTCRKYCAGQVHIIARVALAPCINTRWSTLLARLGFCYA